MASSISELIGDDCDVELGKAYSIRVNGRPIAGHGQHLGQGTPPHASKVGLQAAEDDQYFSGDRAFMYHGVLSVAPWNVESIKASMKIRREDSEELKTLPSLSRMTGMGVAKAKQLFIDTMLRHMDLHFETSSVSTEQEVHTVMQKAASLSQTVYGARDWVYRTDVKLKEDARFCLLYEG